MSSAANWSYTARATHWPKIGRDDWSGVDTFGPPVSFDCDYSAKAERRTDSLGVEFVSSQIIYTERASIQPGDRVMLGELSEANPIAAGASIVRAVARHADTFERIADDYEVVT